MTPELWSAHVGTAIFVLLVAWCLMDRLQIYFRKDKK